ncbi:MAG TPA: glycosyltransferase family 39 protein [Candidatus Polarisedimenticolia bacterium]|nr:glycosyltransferase family 39 protein [Candidatus Polarisedimenticolia bacterium]
MTASMERASPRAPRSALVVVGLLAVYVLSLQALLRPGGGLRGRYFIRGEGGVEIAVHERIDADLNFPVPQRLDSAYIFHWDMRRHGFPATMPPYSIHWTGLLLVPQPGTYGFSVDVQGEAALQIDGSPLELQPDTLTERSLSAGWHPVAFDYALGQGDARVVLSWRPPGQSVQPIPSRFFAPDPAAVTAASTRRGLGWGLLAAGAALALAGVILGRRERGAVAGLLASLRSERVTLALGAIIVLAALLRFHDHALVPFHHETADEYQHAWEGWSLLHQGVPAAWSMFPDRYPMSDTVDFRWFGDRYVVVRPYFDHPPLFSLIVGLVTSLRQSATYPIPWDFLSGTLPLMRVVPILLSLAGIVLLYRLARSYGVSERAALLGTLVYATLPLIVLAHRLVKAESLLAILFMGAILAAHRHRLSGRMGDAVVAGVLGGLSIWTKATGVAVVGVVLVLLLSARRFRGALLALGLAAGFLALYLVYAWTQDFGIFLKVIQAQSTSKWVGLESLQDLLTGKIVTKYFGRGWYLWLLLCAGLAAFRRERAILMPLALYGTLIALTADHRVIYGWYRIPLYPFLCVAAGTALERMISRGDLYRVFPFAITAVATGALYAWSGEPLLIQSKPAVALFALIALLPFLVRLAFESALTERIARLATWVLLAAFLLTSLIIDDGLLEIYSATRGLR